MQIPSGSPLINSTATNSNSRTNHSDAAQSFSLMLDDSKAKATPDAIAKRDAQRSENARREFEEYMEMSVAERRQYAWLKQRGISKEEFESLPPEEQEALIEEMQQDIAEKVKQKAQTGAMDKSYL